MREAEFLACEHAMAESIRVSKRAEIAAISIAVAVVIILAVSAWWLV